MKNRQPTEETFLKDVAKHEMRVLLDNGVYRHLQFKQPGSSNAWFDVVTWPGFLAYTGDMGAYVFSRLPDMFEFFRGKTTGPLDTNLRYWGEKLEAVDRCGVYSGHKVYSSERLREHIEEQITSWMEDFGGPYDPDKDEEAAAKRDLELELREAVEQDVYIFLDDSEAEARIAVRDFSVTIDGQKYEFSDTWEWDCTEYTFRFIWCCYAIAWSIRQYDAAKVPA